jgi:hypothetical protein
VNPKRKAPLSRAGLLITGGASQFDKSVKTSLPGWVDPHSEGVLARIRQHLQAEFSSYAV